MGILALILPLIEFSLNNILSLDQEVFARFNTLRDKVIAVEVKGLSLTLFLLPHADGIQLRDVCSRTIDATIQGTPLALLNSLSASDEKKIINADVTVRGDVGLVQDFQAILQSFDIDWEEQLSRFTGDITAHKVGNCVRKTRDWGRESCEVVADNVGEYLQEELRLLPPREELNDFYNDVDILRADAERLSKHVHAFIESQQND